MQNADMLQYVTGPLPLAGLALVVLAGLVPLLGGRRGDRKGRRWLILGLLGMGLLTTLGGIGLEVLRIRADNLRAKTLPSAESSAEASYQGPATQEAHARDNGTAIAAGGNVNVDGTAVSTGVQAAGSLATPATRTTQKANAEGHGTAISAGGNVTIETEKK